MKNFKATLIENLVLKNSDSLLGTQLFKQLKIHRSYTHLSEDLLCSLQSEKLKSVLKHATSTCKFYKSYSSLENNPFEWLKQFPIIDKSYTNQHTNDLLSTKFDFSKLIKYETSGSSGIRSVVYIDKKEQSTFRAILLNWWEWNGYNIGNPILQTGISPQRGVVKSLKDILLSTIYLDAFGMSEEDAIQKLNKANNQKNCVLFGYASSLYSLAIIAEKNNLKCQFKIAMSQGDKLFEHYKKKIEEVFNCKVVEDYGLNEGIMIGQKKDLPYYYYYTPSVYLEVVDDEGNAVEDGKMGRIIATKLDGFAMPLIRYDTGDLGIMLPKEKYPVKRDLNFPLIETIIGRNTDIINTNDGKVLIVHTFTGIFEFFPEIKQFQVVQKQLDKIVFRYIKSDIFNSSVLLDIEIMFRERTKSSIQIEWESVEKIEASKSGKPQIIINELLKKSLSTITV